MDYFVAPSKTIRFGQANSDVMGIVCGKCGLYLCSDIFKKKMSYKFGHIIRAPNGNY